jgi:glucoamylase
MPLVWAHAEHIKLLRSLRDERVFDMPPQPRRRYQVDRVQSRYVSWRPNQKTKVLPAGKILRIELAKPALMHWSRDNWRTGEDTKTRAASFGMHIADIDSTDLVEGDEIVFALYWQDEQRWDGEDYRLKIV